MDDQHVAFNALIEGRVQGVGFRYFVLQQAEELFLTGWVRNRGGGQVEVFAEGPREKLDLLISHIERGPRAAHVSNVTIDWQPATGKHGYFSIIATGW